MMMTAYGDEYNYNQAIKLGADDFFTKPVDFDVLKEKLKLSWLAKILFQTLSIYLRQTLNT